MVYNGLTVVQGSFEGRKGIAIILSCAIGPIRWPAGIFSESSHTSDIKIGTPVATLPVLGLVGPVSVYCD